MSKNNIFDKEEIEKLRLDMAGSFFIDLIGQNMPAFVKILQKIVKILIT